MIDLKTNKEYEWFLMESFPQRINGYPKFHLVWSCVEADYKVVERPELLPDGRAGPRLVELMRRINPMVDATNPPLPPDFFIKGKVHLFAKVQRRWVEGAKDRYVFDFTYETIKPTSTKQTIVITDAMRTKTKFLAGKATSLAGAKDIISKNAPELMVVLEELVKTGEVVFA